MIASFPSILNVLAVRNLDNATRQVQTYLQMTKLQAVSTKIVHRVRFFQPERDVLGLRHGAAPEPTGPGSRSGRAPRKTIPASFNVTVDFPQSGADRHGRLLPVGTFAGVRRRPELPHPSRARSSTARDQMDERVHEPLHGRFDPLRQEKERLR
ncbi:MAG: hypothetical protein MZW92_61420 [Comamonadaceae bacterium]|nr:hypothetical protein [Comamonadaceae bacterium]